ncbi:MAG TPA: D-2-hydroxyacid dehydrogenase [Candidatus Eisenbacteria bacterium]|nr:D-2-hydroxyacid dehydrogenase [Candidatus Eisenbacteria bacterium]
MRRLLLWLEDEAPAWRIPDAEVEALARDFPDLAVERARTDEELLAKIADAEIAFAWRPDDDVWARAKRLRWLHVPAAGAGAYLTPGFNATGALLTSSRGAHAIPIAEHVIGSLLALARDFTRALDEQRSAPGMNRGGWWTERGMPHDLFGKTLGIFGYGLIGREVARRASGFGMRVVALKRDAGTPRTWDDALLDAIRLPREEPEVAEFLGPGDFGRLLETSDALVLSAALTPETEGRFDEAAFARVKPGAWLVNIARGRLVKEPALAAAVRSGRIGGAALDVTAVEPLPRESELYTLDRVLLTPHVSGVSRAFWPRAMSLFRENLARDARGEALLNRVDPARGY